MASNALSTHDRTPFDRRARAVHIGRWRLSKLLMPLASLRLTVAPFAMGIFLIFAGTLAQVDRDIWDVMSQYFRTFVAWIPFQVFFPKSFFAGDAWRVPGGFWFPGGWLIGGAMGINLLAVHGLRFKVQARGARRAGRGRRRVGARGVDGRCRRIGQRHARRSREPFAWSTMWTAMKWILVGLWLAGAYGFTRLDRSRAVGAGRWSWPKRRWASCLS